MKKIIILLCILVSMSGCSKKLICTREEKKDSIQTNEEFIIGYQDDKVDTIQLEVKVTLDSKYKDYGEQIKENLKEQFKEFENIKGITLQTGNQDNIVRAHLMIVIDQMKEKDRKKLNIINLKEDMKNVKKTLEKQKYTCS